MLNVFNGPPVSFNRDGGPSLAYGTRAVTKPAVVGQWGQFEIRSTGRSFYLVGVSRDPDTSGDGKVYVQRKSVTQITVGSGLVSAVASCQFGSVDTSSTTYSGYSTASPSAADAWIGYDPNAGNHFVQLAYPLFCPANEIITLSSEANSILEISIFWVETVQT